MTKTRVGDGATGDATVRFRVRDAHFPTPEQLLDELYGDRFLEGQVVVGEREDADPVSVVIRIDDRQLMVVVSRRGLTDAPILSALPGAGAGRMSGSVPSTNARLPKRREHY